MMKAPNSFKYAEHTSPSADAVKRRMQKKKKLNGSSMTTDESKTEDGNSRLSSIKKVTDY